MKPFSKSRFHKHLAPGFALVVTLLLMVLLTIIGLGLLTLSQIELRGSGRTTAAAIARSNARLAMALALGEIQKELGPDQRVNAVSDILSPDSSVSTLAHSHLTGVWNSRQEAPAAVPPNSAPNYDHLSVFRRWLVSSADPGKLASEDFAKTGTQKDPLIMARAPGTAGGQATYADKIPLVSSTSGMQGKLAWWVSDENSKGFINPKETITKIAPPVISDLLTAAGTPGAYGMMAIDKNFPANDPKADKVITHGQLPMAVTGIKPSDWFHDVSPYSKGLLTNVVQGGLRQDLSLYLEQTAAPFPWSSATTPLVSGVSGPNGKYALSTVNDYDVLSWKYLYNYYHIKERIQMNGPRPFLTAYDAGSATPQDDLTNPKWNAGVIRPAPILVRAVAVVACGAIPATPVTVPPTYRVRFYTYPVLSVWNPYNVDLKINSDRLAEYFSSLPISTQITVKKNGVASPVEKYDWHGTTAPGGGVNDFSGNGMSLLTKQTVTLAAGEVKMFSPDFVQQDPGDSSASGSHMQRYDMKPVAYDYSFAYVGTSGTPPHARWGVWGAVAKEDPTATGKDQVIMASGADNDTVDLKTAVRYWNGGSGTSYQNTYLSTFDIRSQHAGMSPMNYQLFLWGRKLNWFNETGMPPIASPDRLSVNNQLTGQQFSVLRNRAVPFLIVDVQLKGLDEVDLPNKTWRDCIPSFPYQASPTVLNGKTPFVADAAPYFANAYKLTFTSIKSFGEAANYLNCDSTNNRTFIGSSNKGSGQSLVTDQEIPLAPFTSLAQLQNLPQTSSDDLYFSGFYFQNHAIGNSFASPGVASDKIKSDPKWSFYMDRYINQNGGDISGAKFVSEQTFVRPNIDRSYAANHLLWDNYFFSSMASTKNDKLRTGVKKSVDVVVKEFFEQGKPLANERFKPYLDAPAAQVSARFVRGTEPKTTAINEVAANLMLDGSFNINSTSVAAWRTVLASAHNRNIVTMGETGAPAARGDKNFVVSRFSLPNDGGYGTTGAAANKWQGYHELTEAQIEKLAQATVRQIKKRGPFRSLAEFVNRRLGPEADERTQCGALQAALDDPEVTINEQFRNDPADLITAAQIAPAAASIANKTAALGPRAQGAPPYMTQADVLNSLGSVISARSDTFLIRSYGEARGADGKVTATAWCEAVVQRTPGYLDPKDNANVATLALTSAVNKSFGRRFNIVSFRWLNRDEI